LGIHHITGNDIRTDRNQYARSTYNVEILDDFSWDAVSAFDFVLICTPPDLQYGGGHRMCQAGQTFLH
jgi:hypothetical protein